MSQPRMPTYFFHTYDGAEFVDQIGTELPNDAKAHCEAVKLAGAMLYDAPQLLFAGRAFRTEVVSESGDPLFTIVAQATSVAAANISSAGFICSIPDQSLSAGG